MAQVLLLAPALVAGPGVRVDIVLRAGCVEVAVGLLCLGDDVEHRVDVVLELGVGIRLQDVARALDGLVGIGVVEAVGHELGHVVLVRRVLHVVSRPFEVLVAALGLALAEGQGDGDLARGLQPLSPERIVHDLYRCKRHRCDGIACRSRFLLCVGRQQGQCRKSDGDDVSHISGHLISLITNPPPSASAIFRLLPLCIRAFERR